MSVRLPSLAFACLVVATLVNGCGFEQHQQQPNLSNVSIRSQSDVQAIQGGTVDTTSSNVVGILINMNGGVAICTGSLIAPNLVLTAHHCVANDGPGDIGNCNATGHFGTQLTPGSFRITMNTNAPASAFNTGTFPAVDNSTWFGVSAVATSGSSICGGDMAVLRLSTNINSVCPLIPRVDSAPGQNEGFTAIGFGATSQSQTAPAGTRYTLNGFMSVECPSNCGQGMSQTQEWFGLSSATNRGVCEGDSGGPALDSQRRVLGTVSRGSASACDQAVYESVFGLATWLKSEAQSAATAGGYTAAPWVTGGSTSINPCTGVDGGVGGGAGGGTGGAGGGAPVGGGGGGGGTGTCPSGQACFDVSQGQGVFECLTTAGGVPSSAATCSQTVACAAGSTCFVTMQGATTGICLIDCGGTGTGGGGGTPVGGGTGGGTGGGGGGAPMQGSCSVPGNVCFDASGQGDFACLDPNTSTGIPANAPACSQTAPCATGFTCWGAPGGGNVCLEDCTTGGTGGGGGGSPIGGGTGGGVTGGGTGGGVTGGGTGGGVTGGGTGGGVTGGGTGGGTTGGGTGGGTTGGGTGGGTTGGGTGGGTTGGGAAGGAGAGSQGGGFTFPGLPMEPKKPGCGCTEVPFDAVALALSGMLLFRRRRRS